MGLLSLLSINLVNSWIEAPVDDNILEILLVDGHRGCPSLVQRLLRLNVVGSKPLHRAKPEQDIPCSVANRSMARQTSSCVINFPPFLCITITILWHNQKNGNRRVFLGKTGYTI